jgi:hypothetical protein
MFFIAGSWLILFLFFVLAGTIPFYAYVRMSGRRYYCPIDIFRLAWLGYAFSIGILQLYSLFFRIDFGAFATIGLLAAACGTCARAYLQKSWQHTCGSLNRLTGCLYLGLLVAVIALLAFCSTFPPIHYDTELYHLNAVRWASRYPAIPGIANLHGRLAFNSSFHLFAALTNFSAWGERSIYLANGFILCLASAHWLYLLLASSRNDLLVGRYFAAFTLPFLLTSAFTWSIPSLSTDLPFHLLGLVVIRELMSLQSTSAKNGGQRAIRDNAMSWFIITALSATVFSTKMTGAPFMLLLPVAAYAVTAHRRHSRLRLVTPLVLMPSIIVAGLILRHCVLSGWLLFPLPFGNLHLDWSAQPKFVMAQLNWAKSWARFPGKHYQEVLNASFSYWFFPWVAAFRQNQLAVLLLSIGAAGTAISAMLAGARRVAPAVGFNCAASLMLSVAGLAYWFMSAPDYRLGELYFWAFAATASAPVIISIAPYAGRLYLPLSLILLGAVMFMKFRQGEVRLPPIAYIRDAAIYGAPRAYGPQNEIVPVTLRNGQVPPLVIFRPTATDQCGNSELPCSPYVAEDSSIKLREPGNLRSGFRATGEIPAGIQY